MNQRKRSLTIRKLQRLGIAAAVLITFVATGAAQSTDTDNPTPMTTNVVTGKSNGKAKTVYYSFTATGVDPGEVKVKVTASTDERSTNLRVNFFNEDGQKVMDEIYVIPNRDPATKVGRHTFADRQKVIMRITLPDDPQVNLLTYKIEVSGAVEFEQPATTPTDSPTAPMPDTSSAEPVIESTAAQSNGAPSADQSTAASSGEQPSESSLKQKAKDKAKNAANKTANKLLNKIPF